MKKGLYVLCQLVCTYLCIQTLLLIYHNMCITHIDVRIPASWGHRFWRPRSVDSRSSNSVKLSWPWLIDCLYYILDGSIWRSIDTLFSVEQSSWTIDPCHLWWKIFDPLFSVDQSTFHFVDQHSVWINSLVFLTTTIAARKTSITMTNQNIFHFRFIYFFNEKMSQ